MKEISLNGQRAIVTGAGKGIGRAHALELARRGAAVLVNDFDRGAADSVVETIKAGGGSAAAAYDAVGSRQAGQAIVDQALEKLGGVEIVINNAGFLRPGLFQDLTEEQIDAVLDAHLLGTLYVTQAAWPVLQRQSYGRVVLTSSSSGMFAHQGMANYSAAKAGTFGLMKALAYEGDRHNIRVNALLPYAETTINKINPIPEMAENYAKYIGPDLTVSYGDPAMVSHMAAYLVSRECEVTGEAFSICCGRFARVFVGVADGWLSSPGDEVSAEAIGAHLSEIRDITRHSAPKWLFEEVADVARRVQAAKEAARLREGGVG